MKALVLTRNGQLEYQDHELAVTPGWVKIRVDASGVCGSDLGRAFRSGAYHYPLVMGHEFAGTVAELPAGTAGKFKIGDRVAVYPLLNCQSCPACLAGDYQLCENYDYLGSRRDGGFAEFVMAPEHNLVPVPAGVTMAEAAMTEPAAVAHHGVAKLAIRPGDAALIFGGGPIGILAAQWLRIGGCGEINIVDIDPAKHQLARQLGFIPLDPGSSQFAAAVKHGFPITVEACGIAQTREQAIAATARAGQLLLIGNAANAWTIEPKTYSQILRKELRLLGAWNSKIAEDWVEVLAHTGRDLQLKPLISHEANLAQGAQIFAQMTGGKDFFCKVIFNCQRGSL